MNLADNSAGQIVPYQVRKKFLEIKQIFFAVEMQGTERVLYIPERKLYFLAFLIQAFQCSSWKFLSW